MSWCNSSRVANKRSRTTSAGNSTGKESQANLTSCPSCGHRNEFCERSQVLQEFAGLPAGAKFDPSDQEILEHLRRKARPDVEEPLHPLIDHFIPTIDGDEGICYTHPENLPGVRKDGLVRHFFHRPFKAYATGNRKRRKVFGTGVEFGAETRWHKTGKTRPVFARDSLMGHKKIMVLYANYGGERKREKTNWVMHQYHLGCDEYEKDGELVVSKVLYQTQPRTGGVSTAAAKADEVEPAVQSGADTGVSTARCHNSSSPSLHNNLLQGGLGGGATDGPHLLPSLPCKPLADIDSSWSR